MVVSPPAPPSRVKIRAKPGFGVVTRINPPALLVTGDDLIAAVEDAQLEGVHHDQRRGDGVGAPARSGSSLPTAGGHEQLQMRGLIYFNAISIYVHRIHANLPPR
jgi:hypothetical protein